MLLLLFICFIPVLLVGVCFVAVVVVIGVFCWWWFFCLFFFFRGRVVVFFSLQRKRKILNNHSWDPSLLHLAPRAKLSLFSLSSHCFFKEKKKSFTTSFSFQFLHLKPSVLVSLHTCLRKTQIMQPSTPVHFDVHCRIWDFS